MKIIVVHGDNAPKSYERLRKFIDVAKKRGWEIVRVTDNAQNIAEVLVSESLFGTQKLVIVEGINLVTKKFAVWLKKNAITTDAILVIYHRGLISKTALKSLPKPDKVEEYKLPKLIWAFLDSFFPGNARNCLLLLHEVIKNEPLEFVFSLLAKQVRDLYWIKTDSSSIPYPPWRVGKLGRQASKLSKISLKEIVADMAEADIKAKTSRVKLIDSLDFIIATKLE